MMKSAIFLFLLVGVITASLLNKDNQQRMYAQEYGSGVELLSDISEKY